MSNSAVEQKKLSSEIETTDTQSQCHKIEKNIADFAAENPIQALGYSLLAGFILASIL